MKYTGALVSLAALTAALSFPAIAQETGAAQSGTADKQDGAGGIADIVVTAQKRAENVQDVPIAISAFTASALQERAVASVASLSNIAPNVTLDAGTPFSGSSSVLSAYNPFKPPFLDDPYEFLAKARREEPVFYSPEIDHWVVTRGEARRVVCSIA